MAINPTWKPSAIPTTPVAARGNNAPQGARDLEGYTGIGTYGANFTDDGDGGMVLELNSAVAKNGKYAGAYPIRQLPELFGLARESFTDALVEIIKQITEEHGELQENGTIDVNFQPIDKSENVNYQERTSYCVALSPGNYLAISGFFVPNEPDTALSFHDMMRRQSNETRPRDQYMIRIGHKSRLSQDKPRRVETKVVLKTRDDKPMSLEIIVDKQEAAVRGHFSGFQLSRVKTAAPAPATTDTK